MRTLRTLTFGFQVLILRTWFPGALRALDAIDRATAGRQGAPEGNQNAAKTNGVNHPICFTVEEDRRDRYR
jgi:hypothetical protein